MRPEPTHRHALVVGGTGMLTGATIALGERATTVTAMARNVTRLKRLHAQVEAGGASYRPQAVDYRDAEALSHALSEVEAEHGPVDLVLGWFHDEESPRRLASSLTGPVDVFHVLGSGAAGPGRDPRTDHDAIRELPGVSYFPIVLGFQVQGGRSRWLTHDEIVAGCLEALDARTPLHVVGTVTPWSARP
ncbi:MAG: short-chain dehydrogenase [Acidobacteriota bacterium]